MSRFLFVVAPTLGCVDPLLGVATELVRRGHEVAWAGCDDRLGEPTGSRFTEPDVLVTAAERMAPGVHAAVMAFEPDVVVADQRAVAGALVAERLGVPCVTSAADLLVAPGMPGWLAGLRARLGDPALDHDPRYPPHGTLAFTAPELLAQPPPPGVRLVGPVLEDRGSFVEFPWAALEPGRPTVLVSVDGAAGGRFLRLVVRALATLGAQGVVVDPKGVLSTVDGRRHVVPVPYPPRLECLPRLAAVVAHGEHDTACEALWHGVPLVLAPVEDHQSTTANLVVDAGAAVRVRFGGAKVSGITAALATVLDPTSPQRLVAGYLARSLRRLGGAGAAAGHLVGVTSRRRVVV